MGAAQVTDLMLADRHPLQLRPRSMADVLPEQASRGRSDHAGPDHPDDASSAPASIPRTRRHHRLGHSWARAQRTRPDSVLITWGGIILAGIVNGGARQPEGRRHCGGHDRCHRSDHRGPGRLLWRLGRQRTHAVHRVLPGTPCTALFHGRRYACSAFVDQRSPSVLVCGPRSHASPAPSS